MALNFTPVYPAAASASTPAVDLSAISPETRAEVEEAISFFASKSGENVALTVEFPDKTVKARWTAEAQSYALNRPTDKGEPWVLRVSPQRGTTDSGKLQFRMYPKSVYDARKAESAKIREAAKGTQNGQATAAAPATETHPKGKGSK